MDPMTRHANTHIARCNAAKAAHLAVAACYFAVALTGSSNVVDIQLTPAGQFAPRDGRDMGSINAWQIDAASATAVMAKFNRLRTPLVVDYEHQTLEAANNGQPAPAAGFIKKLEWREGAGLFAQVELTQRAADFVRNGEYRYISPVFRFDANGTVTELLMAAFTNNPALDGMAETTALAAAKFSSQPTHETESVNKFLLAILTFLAIKPDSIETDEQAAQAIQEKLDAEKAAHVALTAQLELKEGETVEQAVVALKAKAVATAPDPKEFVSVGVMRELQDQVATLTAQNSQRDVDALVESALEDGRLLKSQESWARQLGAKDMASLKTYLADAKPIAALRGTQTGGLPQEGDKDGLSAAEVAICSAMGVTADEFKKAKGA